MKCNVDAAVRCWITATGDNSSWAWRLRGARWGTGKTRDFLGSRSVPPICGGESTSWTVDIDGWRVRDTREHSIGPFSQGGPPCFLLEQRRRSHRCRRRLRRCTWKGPSLAVRRAANAPASNECRLRVIRELGHESHFTPLARHSARTNNADIQRRNAHASAAEARPLSRAVWT